MIYMNASIQLAQSVGENLPRHGSNFFPCILFEYVLILINY